MEETREVYQKVEVSVVNSVPAGYVPVGGRGCWVGGLELEVYVRGRPDGRPGCVYKR